MKRNPRWTWLAALPLSIGCAGPAANAPAREDPCARLIRAGFEPLGLEVQEVDHFEPPGEYTIPPEALEDGREPTAEELAEDLRLVTFCDGKAYAGPRNLAAARWIIEHENESVTAGEYLIGDDGLVEDEQTGVVTDVRSCRRWLPVEGRRIDLPPAPGDERTPASADPSREPRAVPRDRRGIELGRICPGYCGPEPASILLAAEPWVPGHYTVHGRADGLAFECRFDRPGSPAGQVGTCEPGDLAVLAGPRPGTAPVALLLPTRPKTVDVEVTRDGLRLLQEVVHPEVRVEPPERPECPPSRWLPSIRLKVPPGRDGAASGDTAGSPAPSNADSDGKGRKRRRTVLDFPDVTLDGVRLCTEKGGPTGLGLSLLAYPWLPGHYVIRGRADGVPFACHLELPFGRNGKAGCEQEGVQVSPARHPNDSTTVDLRATPSSLEVEVLRDGAEIARKSFRPEYRVDYPNGYECGPPRRFGNELLILPSAAGTTGGWHGKAFRECPETRCPAGVHIRLASGTWQPSHLEVEGRADGVPFRCDGQLPPRIGTRLHCEGQDVELVWSHVEGTIGEHSEGVLTLSRRYPTTVEVTVRLDGREREHREFRPEFLDFWPHGQHCANTCRQAFRTIEIHTEAEPGAKAPPRSPVEISPGPRT